MTWACTSVGCAIAIVGGLDTVHSVGEQAAPSRAGRPPQVAGRLQRPSCCRLAGCSTWSLASFEVLASRI